jgi:uncharacterized protein
LVLVAACAAPPVSSSFPTTEVSVGGQHLTVWVAVDAGARRQGLSKLDRLPDGIEGMLFSYEAPTTVSYWMKDTTIPLDIWFFEAGGALMGSAGMDPCPGGECPTYDSPGPVAWVLETPRGTHVFELGDLLATSGFG